MKRFAALILALIMTLSLCPVTALAELIPETYEMSVSYVAEDDGISNDELFAAYAQREFDEALGIETPSFYSTSALAEGTVEKDLYDTLKAELAKIAAGTTSSTEITVEVNKTFTKTDLGVTGDYISDGSLSAETVSAIAAKIDMKKVYSCLLADCPLELYWHDKTMGVGMPYVCSIYDEELTVTEITYRFTVATDYSATGSAGTFVTNINKTSATSTAVTNAQAIVTTNAAKSDSEKLTAYKEKICEMVSYDTSAAVSTPSVEGINPWQMIYVFDGDEETNVVCEGYAKAFQYLCDLTDFKSEKIECHTVQGVMSGGTGAGNHMWNVVTMDDGKNYLVDVTNCDAGTIGADDKLFMAYTENSANDNQTHTFTIDNQNITFTYDETMEDLFCEGYLDLATTAYNQSIAPSVSLSGSRSVQAGTDVKLTLTVSGTNIMGVEATLDYDEEVLEYRSYSGLLDGWDVIPNGEKFVMYGVKNPINEASDVVSVTFRVKEGTAAGTQLSAAFKDIVVSNGNEDISVGTGTWKGSVVASPEARWGLATGENSDQMPAVSDWTSGTLFQAKAYANSLTKGTAYIQMLSDVETSETIEFAEGKTVILDLNGCDIDRGLKTATLFGEVIIVNPNGSLTLCDSSATATSDPGKITGGFSSASDGAGVFVRAGTFTMNGGSITGNKASADYNGGGGVHVQDGTFIMNGGSITKNTSNCHGGGVYGYGTFTMNGGSITGNTASAPGGGVFWNQGSFTMHGGTISGNIAESGGGVCSHSSSFAMTGGTIAENTAETNGGGVYVSWGAFAMTDGTISKNTATTNGGGVYIRGGTFTMNGGSLSENVANVGGAVAIREDGTLIMNNGAISKNTAANGGGGVKIHSGTFTMNNGSICENTASAGGGVVINFNCTFTMNDGVISGNITDGGGGGGVVVSGSSAADSGVFTMNGGTISANEGSVGGGVSADGLFTMTAGTICGNTADYGGGVASWRDDANFTMTGGTIFGNNASNGGGGIHFWRGTMQISGSPIISGNVMNGTLNETTGHYEIGAVGSLNNVHLHGIPNITVAGALSDAASIGVTTPTAPTSSTPVTVATGSDYTLTTSDAAKFTSDNGHLVELDSANNQILLAKKPGVTVSGTVTSYLDATADVTVELWEEGAATATYTTTVKGNSASYSLSSVAAGTYTMKVIKANHVTREYTVTVDDADIALDAKIHPVGDINGDGRVNITDVGMANSHAKRVSTLTGYAYDCGNVNGDARINISDVGMLNAHAKRTNTLW